MIQETVNITPYIDFGFGILTKTVATNETVTIWLSTLYSADYQVTPVHPGATMVKVSDYQMELIYDIPGAYEITVTVTDATKIKNLVSNTLTINIV